MMTSVMTESTTTSTPRTGAGRAAVMAGPHTVRVERTEPPTPGRGQVRVRLHGCGLCASNLPVWEGRPWFTYPLSPGAPGHEGWGVIDELGPDVTGPPVGTAVAVLSYNAFADWDLAAADAVVPLPSSLVGTPMPGEPLACAVNAFARSGVREGQTVAIVGVGFLGALLVQLSARAGAHVIGISRRDFARDVAERAGAAETIPLDDGAAARERVQELTDGRGCDRVIEAVGIQESLDLASDLTREGGRLIIAGYHQDGWRRVNMQLWNWRGLDVINAHERDPRRYIDGMKTAVDLVASGALDPAPLFTHRFPLEMLGEACQAAIERPDGFLKALVLT